MMLSALYQRLLGTPFVYDKVRPLLLGGIDLGPFYRQIGAREEDSILDIGCGTGNALCYLPRLAKYTGYDTDPLAIGAARKKWSTCQFAAFEHGECRSEDVKRLEPTRVVLCGVLHHLPDEVAIFLLRSAAESEKFISLHTLDVAHFPGAQHALSNTLAALDRGKFVRNPQGYLDLVERAGLRAISTETFWNHPHRPVAKYFTTKIVRPY